MTNSCRHNSSIAYISRNNKTIRYTAVGARVKSQWIKNKYVTGPKWNGNFVLWEAKVVHDSCVVTAFSRKNGQKTQKRVIVEVNLTLVVFSQRKLVHNASL